MTSNSDYDWFWAALDKFLDTQGLKVTNQRKIIAECLLGFKKHFNAEELHTELKDQGNDIGIATVYRTLNLFKDAGLLIEKVFQNNKVYFEVDDPNDHHDHLICLDCNTVVEFENDEIEKLQVQIAQKYGFTLADHRLDMWGKCIKTDCQFKKNK